MRLKVDQKADALYLSLSDAPANRSEEVSPGIIVDYDEQNHVVGVEMLDLSKRAPGHRNSSAIVRSCLGKQTKKNLGTLMASTTIDHLIMNSPYEEPKHH